MKESENIEFKKSTSELKEAVVSIAAMLNKQGYGTIYFGITDDGQVSGLTVGRETLKQVTQTIVDNIEPKIYPSIEEIAIDGKSCIKVEFKGINSPYFAYGRAYVRVGESDKSLSLAEIESRILKKNKIFWDREVSLKTIQDVNLLAVEEFVRKAKDAKRIDFIFTNVKATLNKLHLLDGDQLTNAGEVLFCEDNSLELQAATFAGNDRLTFLDIKTFTGDLFSLRNQAELYVNANMRWRADLSESRRKEIPEVPVRALSEAIGNSLCHRDFAIPKSNEVAIYKNRIEIYNPGPFPEGIEPEDFFSGIEHSVLRNPLIAETMFRSRDIERWGSGIKRINDECAAAGIKVEFNRIKTGFVVCFYRPDWDKDKPSAILGLATEKVTKKVTEKVTENQSLIVTQIKKNGFITSIELAHKLGISRKSIIENLSKLKRMNLVKRIGPAKGGHWETL